MEIKGAIFDLDGTLLDSMYLWDTIGSDYLKNRGIIPEPGVDEKIKTMSLVQGAEYFRARYGIQESVSDILKQVDQQVYRLYAEEIHIKHGVRCLLEQLNKQHVKMCVATATNRRQAEAALKHNEIDQYFCGIFTCTEVGHGKDEPVIYEKALEFLGTPKTQTVVYEDALHAMETAKKAGFPIIAVYDTWEAKNQDKIKEIADAYIYF